LSVFIEMDHASKIIVTNWHSDTCKDIAPESANVLIFNTWKFSCFLEFFPLFLILRIILVAKHSENLREHEYQYDIEEHEDSEIIDNRPN
jgi:hypothetical protein